MFVWARASHTPLRNLGFIRPKNWIAAAASGIALGVALKFLTKAVIMPMLGADPVNHVYQFVSGNPAVLASMTIAVILSGAFGEETVYRGFLFERLEKVLGSRPAAKIATVILTTALFAAMHYFDQGFPGVEQAIVTGLTFGTIFAITGTIWIPMIAHAAYDIAALALIYWNLETGVAHLIFK